MVGHDSAARLQRPWPAHAARTSWQQVLRIGPSHACVLPKAVPDTRAREGFAGDSRPAPGTRHARRGVHSAGNRSLVCTCSAKGVLRADSQGFGRRLGPRAHGADRPRICRGLPARCQRHCRASNRELSCGFYDELWPCASLVPWGLRCGSAGTAEGVSQITGPALILAIELRLAVHIVSTSRPVLTSHRPPGAPSPRPESGLSANVTAVLVGSGTARQQTCRRQARYLLRTTRICLHEGKRRHARL